MKKMKKNTFKTKEVADIFNINVSNLHYWEKEGLFCVRRQGENGYREYNQVDVFNVAEIQLYRSLDFSIKEIKHILYMPVSELEYIYEEKKFDIGEKIIQLQNKLDEIELQISLINQARMLQANHLTPGIMEVDFLIEDALDTDTVHETLRNPSLSYIYIKDYKEKKYIRAIATDRPRGAIWKRTKGKKYLKFLLKADIMNNYNNNVKEILTEVRAMGYQTGEVVARYLLMGSEGGTRYEYYMGFVEVSNK
ncbi:MAG: MerR family transcriptional regulator [Anaerovoracaceae bacterium]